MEKDAASQEVKASILDLLGRVLSDELNIGEATDIEDGISDGAEAEEDAMGLALAETVGYVLESCGETSNPPLAQRTNLQELRELLVSNCKIEVRRHWRIGSTEVTAMFFVCLYAVLVIQSGFVKVHAFLCIPYMLLSLMLEWWRFRRIIGVPWRQNEVSR